VVQKTAQSLWHHNFTTVHHSPAIFSKMFQKKLVYKNVPLIFFE